MPLFSSALLLVLSSLVIVDVTDLRVLCAALDSPCSIDVLRSRHRPWKCQQVLETVCFEGHREPPSFLQRYGQVYSRPQRQSDADALAQQEGAREHQDSGRKENNGNSKDQAEATVCGALEVEGSEPRKEMGIER